jgi:hypothetical protein
MPSALSYSRELIREAYLCGRPVVTTVYSSFLAVKKIRERVSAGKGREGGKGRRRT